MRFTKKILTLLVLSIPLLVASCVEEAIQKDEGFSLYYPVISEIAPGTNISISPTWYGGSPAEFIISEIMLDDQPFTSDCFSIEGETGTFHIKDSEQLPTGKYSITVSCSTQNATYSFKNAITIEMMKEIPDGITVSPDKLTAKLGDILETGADVSLPSAKITVDGDNHLQIKDYLIANVYCNGSVMNHAKEWFNLSNEGVFTILPDNPDFEAGKYTFDFRLTTYKVGQKDEKGIFPNALELDVTSAPQTLQYKPASAKIEFGMGMQTDIPLVKGSLEGLKYNIAEVSPDNAPGITVDENTGVITFPETQHAELGRTYHVSVEVSNDYGSKTFEDAYTFTIIEFIPEISVFSYEDVENMISGVSFTNPVKDMDGKEVRYSFVNLPEDLKGLQIDPQTGLVSCPKGTELPVGKHTITVQAENVKNKKQSSFLLDIIANPNMFTFVSWGNNLGEGGSALTPVEKYGNQFRVIHGSGKYSAEIVSSDIPEGRPVKFKSIKPATASGGIAINATSGKLDVYTKAAGTTRNTITFTVIEVTVGEGEAAIIRKFPVFVDFCGAKESGCEITYTPFALRINPKTGGLSQSPVVTDKEGNDITDKVSLDFQANAQYYNINGPESHDDPTALKNDKEDKTFLANVWEKYFSSVNQPYNRQSSAPMSYWQNYESNNLNATGGYIEPQTLKLKVNPEKFVDKDGNYADGAMYMTLVFSPSGSNPQTAADKVQVNRLFVWLDPTYNE